MRFPANAKASKVTPAKGSLLPESMDLPQNEGHAQAQNDVELSAKLYTSLCMLRTVLLKEAGEGFAAYHIFVNATLQQISKRIPRTKEELLEINGIGKAKISKYGDRVLDTIESTIREYQKANNESSDAVKRRRESKSINSHGLDDDFAEGTLQSKKQELSAKLYTSLRMLRTVLLKEAGEGFAAYHIFGNATLQQISERIPRTKEELLEINGIGKAKISKYGDRVLDTIKSTIREYQKANNESSDAVNRRRESKSINSHGLDDDFAEGTVQSKKQELSAKLYTSLHMLRTVLLKEAGEGFAAYHIFGNATLHQISERIPRTKEELLEINGIGKAKISKYGDRVLDTIESTIREYQKANNESSDAVKRRRESKSINSHGLDDDFAEGTVQSKKQELSAKLYTSLHMLRTVLLKEAGEGFAAYHIFRNATLQQISKRIPRTKEELLEINGIGKAKISKYGDRVLDTIESTIREYQKANKENSDAVKRSRESKVINSHGLDDDFAEETVQSKKQVTYARCIDVDLDG